MKMAGKRYSKDETNQIKTLIGEGLSNREIASKLSRPEAGIRNIRYRQGLKNKAENETKTLFEQRDTLRSQVFELQRKKSELSAPVESLEKRKQKVEDFLKLNEAWIRFTLITALTKLRRERPELFILNEQEQSSLLIGLLFKMILG
jgi:IS30 family transposase